MHRFRGSARRDDSQGKVAVRDLANRITTCLEMNVKLMALDTQERSSLLAVLEDPPDSIGELRGVLARDDDDRK